MNDISDMSDIIAQFEAKFSATKGAGMVEWVSNQDYADYLELMKYIKQFDEKALAELPANQITIFLLLQYKFQYALEAIDLYINIKALNNIELNELLYCLGLNNPEKHYKTIKATIASPESYMTRISYPTIKSLYEMGVVPFDRQIFAACMVRFNVFHGANFTESLSPDASARVDKIFPKDEFSLDILMAVFEMELKVNYGYYMERELNIGAVIIKLVNDGTLCKRHVQQKMFEAFNNPTLKQSTQTWVKRIYEALEFSLEENLACQSQIIELLYNNVPLVANFALKIIDKLTTNKSTQNQFDWSLFIESLEGIVYRTKFNGGLKLALKILSKRFGKGLPEDNKLLEQTCLNLAPIFIQEDASVQAEAIKFFGLLEHKQNEQIGDVLNPFINTMHSETKTALAHLLSNDELESTIAYERYHQAQYMPAAIKELEPVKYIDNESDFIFLCSKVLKSSDGMDYELFLEALLRYHHIKETEKKALGSALKMAKKINSTPFLDINARQGVYHIYIADLICEWLDSKEGTAQQTTILNKVFNHHEFIIDSINTGKTVALLSTPTHTDGTLSAIDIEIFYDRLAYYEQNNIAINDADFNMALCRLNIWSKSKKTDSSKLNSEYRDIIEYLLAEKDGFDSSKINQLEGSWLTAFIIKNPDKCAATLDLCASNASKWWLAESKNIFEFGRRFSGGGKYSWPRLFFNMESLNDEFYNKSGNEFNINHFSYYLSDREPIIADASHWFLRDGYCLEPLYLSLVFENYRHPDIEAMEQKSIMATILESMKNPAPLGKNGMMYLCLSLFTNDKTVRSTSLDWLCLLIEKRYLNLDLFSCYVAQMLCNEQHPFLIKRVAEPFESLNQLGGVYADVLYIILEAILTDIDPTNLPKSFKDIVHFYYEILTLTRAEIPSTIQANLEAMLEVNSVKKEAEKILSL